MKKPKQVPAKPDTTAHVQGEGDYDAARRFNDSERRFVAEHDVAKEAHDAEPATPGEASELLEAERKGREHAKGEDPQIERP